MPTIIGRLAGATFQTELLIMTALGLVNSTRNWGHFDWTIPVDEIKSRKELGNIVKIVLCWMVKARIIIDNTYTITYLANFYPILTRCRERILFPWLIVSAIDNFLLEFIKFTIILLLYLEKLISGALFIEYIICRGIPWVPAFYYWWSINSFYANIRDRRKLTRANLKFNEESLKTSEIADRIRFGGVSFSDDYYEKPPKFASLTRIDDFLFASSYDYDVEEDYYNRSKSLITVSFDSLESDVSDDNRTLRIFEDDSLSPIEKAMKFLNLNNDDINEARLRVGKNILPGLTTVEKIERIVSTVERCIADSKSTRFDRNVSSIAEDNAIEVDTLNAIRRNKGTQSEAETRLRNAEQSRGTSEKDEENGSPSKVRSTDESPLRGPLKFSSRNPLSGCTCAKTDNDESVRRSNDLRENIKGFVDKKTEEARNNEYEGDDDDSRSGEDLLKPERSSRESTEKEARIIKSSKLSLTEVSQSYFPVGDVNYLKWRSNNEAEICPAILQINHRLTFQSFFLQSLPKEGLNWSGNFTYVEDLRASSFELFMMDNITLEPSEPLEGNSDNVENVSMILPETGGQMVPSEDADHWRADNGPATNDFPPGFSRTSTNQTVRPLESSIDRVSPENSVPHFSKSKLPDLPTKGNKMFTRFSRMKNTLNNIEERESRELRALRAYNRHTLLEDKREMEAKKQNSSFSKRVGLQGFICTANSMNPVVQSIREFSRTTTNAKEDLKEIPEKLDQIPQRQARSRPQQETLKLSTFNLTLDALETSISLSFSSDNKNRSKRNEAKNCLNAHPASTQLDSRKQLSKYSKPMRFQNEMNALSPSTTRIEGLQEGRELDRIPGVENITDRNSIPEANSLDYRYMVETNDNRLENVFSGTIIQSFDNAEIQDDNCVVIDVAAGRLELDDKHRISNIREAIKNIDWDFNDRNPSENDSSPDEENIYSSRENFLWDIVDETDTITLLQSAFSSNPGNNSRGFYLGPGSTQFYSVSNYLDGVVEEIMKSARLTPRPDAFATESSNEIDYGESYLQEFKATSISTIDESSEETLTESDTDFEDTKIDEISFEEDARFVSSDPVEICWNSYSSEGLDVRAYRQSEKDELEDAEEQTIDIDHYQQKLSLKCSNGAKSIADILGEKELSQLEFWTRELKILASNDRRDDGFEFTREFQRLRKMPGFCVVKMLVDFFRDFVTVSRSTMTSRIFENGAGTPSSPASEELIASQLNEPSSISIVDESTNDPGNTVSIDNDVTDVPEFFFGSSNNERSLIGEMMTFKFHPEDNESNIEIKTKAGDLNGIEIIPDEIQAFPVGKNTSDEPEITSDSSDLQVFTKIENSSQVQYDRTALPEDAEEPFEIHSTIDSYDSLYSTAAKSNDSDNLISIGGRSSMEEFSRDVLILASSTESHRRNSSRADNPEINNQN